MDGIRSTEAMDIYFNGLDERDELMFTDVNFGSSFSCRLSVCPPHDDNFCSYSGDLLSLRDIQRVKKQGRYAQRVYLYS